MRNYYTYFTDEAPRGSNHRVVSSSACFLYSGQNCFLVTSQAQRWTDQTRSLFLVLTSFQQRCWAVGRFQGCDVKQYIFRKLLLKLQLCGEQSCLSWYENKMKSTS